MVTKKAVGIPDGLFISPQRRIISVSDTKSLFGVGHGSYTTLFVKDDCLEA